MDGKIPSWSPCYWPIFGSISVLLQFELWLPNQLTRAELLQCPFEWSPCVPNFLNHFCGSVLRALIIILNRIGPRGPRVPVMLLWVHSAPLCASGALVPMCCSHLSSPSLFIRNFPHGTILSPFTRVQTAEIEHVVFPWKIHYFFKHSVCSPICF